MATPLYNFGTATLTNGSAAMVGQGTLWLGNVRPGDQVVSYTGQTAIVGTVDSNTSITLARAYRGASQTAQAYEILYTPDDPFTQQLAREVLQAISTSALVKLGGVTPAARKLVRFDANANAALSDLSDFGLAVAALTGANGGFIRATDAGSAVMQAIVGTVSQSGGIPTGAIIEKGSNANGEYVKFADGTQVCWCSPKTLDVTTAISPLFRSFTTDFTYPAAFTTRPMGFGAVSSLEFAWLNARPLNTATARITVFAPTSMTGVMAEVGAIGRWF